VRQKLADKSFAGKADKDDIDALVAFYGERSAPLWVAADGFTAKAKAAMGEIRKADDWGLMASSFELPDLGAGSSSPEALAEAEAKLGAAVLKYARYARGGRFNPASLSRIIDVTPPIKDPKAVLTEIAATETADAYLRSLHPKHEQFERLRQALIKARGGTTKEEPTDPALKVKLPQGKTIKPGADHADVALLRQRLKVPAEGGKDTLYDPKLVEAVKAFQQEKGLQPNGNVTAGTRAALNGEAEARKPNPDRDVQRLLINMERWRWMPENLGSVYVWDNVPEFMTRVVKGNKEIFKEKIIVGLPEWATPTFSADMKFIIFYPEWGVPDGIKTRELLPRLRNASGGFFGIFGGGGGEVLRAYGLRAYRNGQPVDPDSVDWGSVNILNYSFIQPAGGKNPLGFVKFRFPNRHDVYMHDTVEPQLFARANRALSHGCMRVQNPRRLAEILLQEDKGWSKEKVGDVIAAGGSEISLEKPIPVHVTYFTALVDADGKITTFPDIYGHDSRLAAALTGKPIRFESAVETASAEDDGAIAPAPAATKGKGKKANYATPASDLGELISGLLTN
jgi:murein L,D-transpeptidase YcbB/YkuD